MSFRGAKRHLSYSRKTELGRLENWKTVFFGEMFIKLINSMLVFYKTSPPHQRRLVFLALWKDLVFLSYEGLGTHPKMTSSKKIKLIKEVSI
jgi:hypothetical protein